MIIHTENLDQVLAICSHFNILVKVSEIEEIKFPWVFPLETVNGEPLNDDNEYTFQEFKEKYT